MNEILEKVLVSSLVRVIVSLATWVGSHALKLIRWAWCSLQGWWRSRQARDVTVQGSFKKATRVRPVREGSYNLDLVPLVAGPSREWNELWSDVLRRR